MKSSGYPWLAIVLFSLFINLPCRPWLKSFISNNEMYGVMLQLCGDGSTWLLMLVIVTAAVIPDIVNRTLRDTFNDAYKPIRKQKVRNLDT